MQSVELLENTVFAAPSQPSDPREAGRHAPPGNLSRTWLHLRGWQQAEAASAARLHKACKPCHVHTHPKTWKQGYRPTTQLQGIIRDTKIQAPTTSATPTSKPRRHLEAGEPLPSGKLPPCAPGQRGQGRGAGAVRRRGHVTGVS